MQEKEESKIEQSKIEQHQKKVHHASATMKNTTISIQRDQLVILALAGLFLMAILQTFLIFGTLNQIDVLQANTARTGSFSVSPPNPNQSSAVPATQGGSSLPNNLANLPTQVGGC